MTLKELLRKKISSKIATSSINVCLYIKIRNNQNVHQYGILKNITFKNDELDLPMCAYYKYILKVCLNQGF